MTTPDDIPLERTPRREDAFFLPQPVDGQPGRFVVDATWGHIAPMRLAPGIETVGELEVIEHLRGGGPLVDTRLLQHARKGTIPGARVLPHDELADRLGEIDRTGPTVLYCNGPQCAATPDAIEVLLGAGRDPASLRYYRGGIHDWVTLGLPLARS